MSELLREINTEAQRFLDGDRTDIQHSMHRTVAFDFEASTINIEQTKFISPEDMKTVRSFGATALATTEWFNDVEWLQQPRREQRSWRALHLEASFPLLYFDEKPRGGLFTSEGDGRRWIDQYGSVNGSSDGNGNYSYRLQFVSPDTNTITKLRHPEDRVAFDTYNARYRRYMDDLDSSNASISYYRAWDKPFAIEPLIKEFALGGLSLLGMSVNQVLHQGSSNPEQETDTTRVVLTYESGNDGYIGRDVIIVGDEAVTEPFWDGEDDIEPASTELLETTLELLRNA